MGGDRASSPPFDLYLSLFSLFSESFLGHGFGTNGFLGPPTRPGAPGTTISDCLDPDEWLERHRLQLERPETERHQILTRSAPGPRPKEELYPLTDRRLMSGTYPGTYSAPEPMA